VTKSSARDQYNDVSESEPNDSFDVVYERELEYVWRTLGRLGVPPAEIPDAVHDVFVVVYRRWRDLDPSRPIRPWLFGVARRVAADARKKQRPTVEELEIACAAPAHAERDLLWRALAMLDDERREVLVLHDLEGYTGAEIGQILDIPVNTVHSRLRLARADITTAVSRLRGSR
jgi:RNA polymerase sigma factor (sigma-70 family)